MKKIFIALFLAMLVLNYNARAQIRKIPAEVTEAFKAKYPSASAVEWKDKLTVFQASFESKGEKYEARFNSKGEWQETENVLEESKLPASVKEGLSKSKFSDWEVKEINYIEKKDNTEQYRLLLKKSELEKRFLFFDKTGKLVKDVITL